MLIEQAFLYLPEILHGSGYNRQDYEAGVVGALSLAILQVLNGHNTPNPISCLQLERLFRVHGVYTGHPSARYLRADLYMKIDKLFVGNKRLSQYGWRHCNWLEAKFLRNQTNDGERHAGNKTAHVANFIADLIRLSILVPENGQTHTSSNGRYFLHAYDADPKWYLTFGNRAWMKLLCQPGRQKIKLQRLDQEPLTLRRLLGDFPGLDIELDITNMAITPLLTNHKPCYWIYLTRIDGVKAEVNGHSFELSLDRCIMLSSPEALNEIASFVVGAIHIAPTSPESVAPVEETDIYGDDNEADVPETATEAVAAEQSDAPEPQSTAPIADESAKA